MSVSYLPGTSLGRLRARLGDTVADNGVLPNSANYSDEELQDALDEFGSVEAAAAEMFSRLAASWAREADTRIGEYSVSYRDTAALYQRMANEARQRLPVGSAAIGTAGRITLGSVSLGAHVTDSWQ